MIQAEKLEEIIADQLKAFKAKDFGVKRGVDFQKHLKTNQITVISGIRRSGKSTLLFQFSKEFERFYYVNFDDERLVDFTLEDFDTLMLVFHKLYHSRVVFIDEVQNVERWELFVRRIYEEGYKVFVTGSNAKLLSSDLATRLTGRYFKIELYPFSFKEYLNFEKVDYGKKDTLTRSKILRNFSDYLTEGGFPEYVRHREAEFIKRIYEDVLYKDLLVRFKVKETKSFRELAGFLFSNFTKELSYRSLKNFLGFKSITSVKNYIGFMQESYLIFELLKYDYSLKKQFVSDKKIYVIDNGMRNAVAFSFSEDSGKMLENLVFVELKRRAKEVYYYKGKKECDFIIREKGKITEAIQVTQRIEVDNETRELGGMSEALERFRLKTGLIITEDQAGEKKIGSKKIKIMPAWKWLLE
ncbi:AAA family ATPase [candidate division WOR-1 bacterium RIFCSPLOWO2_12_FULL_45_9]|uniref:AAA family ATPase n=1 Tax=candidate division WOR-1 bacterium RIFCSPLOWO2_12_FULL_45_9 TaxID=1802568 RepID=A0A1F4RL95_UNCSA|nr:MAG: AAA family ATPase [candidate division WOR-1 bacterium RIFCSPLOWO2_12_FULL_45_9]